MHEKVGGGKWEENVEGKRKITLNTYDLNIQYLSAKLRTHQ